VALSLGLLRAMSGVLQGLVDDSTLLFAGITVAVAAVSMLGSYVPARPRGARRSDDRATPD
jgi:hypothetical protein